MTNLPMPDIFDGAPRVLAAIAAGGAILGTLLLLWMLRRIGRGVLRKPQRPIGAMGYLTVFATAAVLLGAALVAGGLGVAMRGYHAFTRRTHVAEVQCIELAPARLRLYYVPIERDGARGATGTYDLDGDQWTVGGEVLRFKPFLTVLGFSTVYKVSRVEGRWTSAADANAHKATAFDLGGGATPGWLALERHGARTPLGWLVAGIHGGAISQFPDRRALYDVYVTDDGFIVDKKTM